MKGQDIIDKYSMCARSGSRLRARVYHASDKQNGACLNVSDEKDEGMINRDLDWLLWGRSQPHHHCGGGCSGGATA